MSAFSRPEVRTSKLPRAADCWSLPYHRIRMKVALFGLAAVAFAHTLPCQTLPEGPGKAVVERMCKGCHGLENVVRSRKTRDRWTEVVDDMVARGAKGTDSEADEVIDYLSTHFGVDAVTKVN